MFDKLVPWNILPERVVYVGNTKQLDETTANLKDATQRIRAQREYIARLERDYNDLVDEYNDLRSKAENLIDEHDDLKSNAKKVLLINKALFSAIFFVNERNQVDPEVFEEFFSLIEEKTTTDHCKYKPTEQDWERAKMAAKESKREENGLGLISVPENFLSKP